MANRRLISKSIHQSNKFLQLSVEDRYLYDELVLYADDDGFCSELTMINVLNHFTEKNYQELEKVGLIIVSDSVVIIGLSFGLVFGCWIYWINTICIICIVCIQVSTMIIFPTYCR